MMGGSSLSGSAAVGGVGAAMRAIRDPGEVPAFPDEGVVTFLGERFEGMVGPGETFDPDTHGWFLVVEPGDDPDAADRCFDCFPLLTSPTGGARYGEPDFQSPFAWVVDHGAFYEGVIVLSDGGEFVGVIVPKLDGIDPRLLAYCAVHAVDEPPEL